MLVVVLARTGGQVVIPEAHSISAEEDDAEVHCVDASGRVLVTFSRADVALYTRDAGAQCWLRDASDWHEAPIASW